MSRVKVSLDHKRIRCLVWLVLTVLALFGYSLQSAVGSAYYSLLMQAYMTVSSPPVILEEGTAGTSTIYTNSTSAKVSVSGYGYDFVDNNDSNVDSVPDKGTHSNFTAQQHGPDWINDTLTEASSSSPASSWLYVDSCDETQMDWTTVGSNPWLSTQNEPTDYGYVTTTPQGKSWESFGFDDLVGSPTINAVNISIYQKSPTNEKIVVELSNSTATVTVTFTATTDWSWMTKTEDGEDALLNVTLPTALEINSATIVLKGKSAGAVGDVYADCVKLGISSGGAANYQLDLEVQWTSVDFDETYEELCIKTGAFSGSEDIMVYAWNVSTSDWHFLYNLTPSSWNNVSVTDWLNNEDFTARFLGGTESSDTNQDSWNIDATLLHVWSDVGTTYDYVLRVNNTATTESWEIRLKKYAEANIDRLENCTIYFHNSSDGTSRQIYIQNGLYINQTGPWYDLGDSETIYIAMTVGANSTGTSCVYVYLEILTSSTTTYSQCIITFEIT
ncbi:hypothetical protein KAU88_01650 [Candidatus Bathyarchaeota archaeon]|nr:hypothetical protein [Candidatus Bathyarchaeota archaeon]